MKRLMNISKLLNKCKSILSRPQFAFTFYGMAITVACPTVIYAQNIYFGERVQVVGSFNSYRTQPYGTDSRTTIYRKVSTTINNPTDGRGQWATTMNVQTTGGDLDAVPTNMGGGNSNGFLFISGPSSNRFQNKWVFGGVGQATLNEVNNITAYNSGVDMGLNMSTPGYYSFTFNDCGYTLNNAKYYVAYTAAAPVDVLKAGETFSGNVATINITTSAAPSPGEYIYVRYRAAFNDFSTGTTIVQATGSGTNWSANIPGVSCGTTYYYYIFTSTRTPNLISNYSESDRTMAVIRYDDNFGANHAFIRPPVTSTSTVSTCNDYTWNGNTYKTSGTYKFSTKTADGCDSIATLNLTIFKTITSNISKTDAACNGQPTGSITVTPNVGTAPFSYRIGTISNFGASNTFTGLRAGQYTVSIKDVNGCEGVTPQITIGQQNTVTANFTKTDLTCFNSNNGTISVTPTGGVSPFSYRLGTSGSFGSNNTFTGLAAGAYRIFVQDANGCGINTGLTIQQPVQVNGTFTSTQTKCNGSRDGSVTVTPTAGVAPFTYRISTSTVYQTSNIFTGLKAGTNIIYIKDANGCENYVVCNVDQPAPISATATKTDASCPTASNGSITVIPSGGVAPYTYRLGSVGSFVTANTFNNLRPGAYRVFVRDANNCSGYSIAVSIGSLSQTCTGTFSGKNVKATEIIANSLETNLLPNPTKTSFTLNLKGGIAQPVSIQVIDVNGRNHETIKTFANQTISFGENLGTGTYIIKVQQGETTQLIKGIKIK